MNSDSKSSWSPHLKLYVETSNQDVFPIFLFLFFFPSFMKYNFCHNWRLSYFPNIEECICTFVFIVEYKQKFGISLTHLNLYVQCIRTLLFLVLWIVVFSIGLFVVFLFFLFFGSVTNTLTYSSVVSPWQDLKLSLTHHSQPYVPIQKTTFY